MKSIPYQSDMHIYIHVLFKPFQNTVREAHGFERSTEVRRSFKCGNNDQWLISSLQLCGFVNKLRLKFILSNPALCHINTGHCYKYDQLLYIKADVCHALILKHLLLYQTTTNESFKGFSERFNTFNIVLLDFSAPWYVIWLNQWR